MTTMAQIVTGAFELMGKVSIGASPEAEDSTYGVGVLNDMLHGWRGKGVDIGHETLTSSETVNLLEEHIEGVKLLLAVNPRMVRRFGWQPDGLTLQEARSAWAMVYAAYASPGPAPQDGALSRMPLRSEGIGR